MVSVFWRASVMRVVLVGVVLTALCACGSQETGVAQEKSPPAKGSTRAEAASDDDKNAASEREAKRAAAAKARRAEEGAADEPAGKASLSGGRTTVSGTEAGEPDREGEDWPQFLGPLGTGVSNEKNLLETWPEGGLKIIWEKTIGTGYSAPSIRGNRLVIPHRIGRKEIVECVRADDGEQIWKHDYKTEYADPYGYNNGPRCSPVLTKDRCYTYGAEGKLVCTNLANGDRVWVRDVQTDFKLPQWFFGIGCSPVLEGDLIIALVGGQPNSGVVAFHKDTGETVWEAVGKKTWDGSETGWRENPTYEWTGEEQVVSYSSPYVATIHGKRHLLVLDRHGLVSLDPATGKENFHYWFMSRTFESVNAARPVVIDDQIFLSAAYLVGSSLLKVNPDGKSYEVVWRNPKNMLNHWSTSLHVDGFIYGFSGRHEPEGELRCLDLATGEVKWAEKGGRGDAAADFYGRGSKIRIGNRFIVLGERGVLALVKVDPDHWEELARVSYPQITYPVWTAPVLSRKRLYLRDEDTLLCLELDPVKGK